MMISEKLAKSMSEQVGRELAASNQYLAIALYFEQEALGKLAAFFFRQADEERDHALKFVHYVSEAGGQVHLPAVPAPRHDIGSAEEAARLSLEWERDVTGQINDLMNQAVQEKDHLAQDFLRWFVAEQLEEVTTMESLLKTIQRAGPNGLLFVEAHFTGLEDPHS